MWPGILGGGRRIGPPRAGKRSGMPYQSEGGNGSGQKNRSIRFVLGTQQGHWPNRGVLDKAGTLIGQTGPRCP